MSTSIHPLVRDEIVIWMESAKFLYDDPEDLAIDCMGMLNLWKYYPVDRIPDPIIKIAKNVLGVLKMHEDILQKMPEWLEANPNN